jgi:GR25 family glycosyltransferase involved in LPS biosynthesis
MLPESLQDLVSKLRLIWGQFCIYEHTKLAAFRQEMIANDWERILVFEDDIRFTENATKILRHTVEDLMKTQTEWDLIYLVELRINKTKFSHLTGSKEK